VEIARAGRGDAQWLRMPGRVDLTERLGREVELSVAVGGQELIVLASSEYSGAEGRSVEVQIPLSDVHVFAPAGAGEDSVRLGALGARAAGQHVGAVPSRETTRRA
jgi:multiple sugar transport system ATP-binding protein